MNCQNENCENKIYKHKMCSECFNEYVECVFRKIRKLKRRRGSLGEYKATMLSMKLQKLLGIWPQQLS